MPPTPTAAPISPDLLGRSAELAVLEALISSLAEGQGRSCTLVGPAGSGKTTLLDAVARRAVNQGIQVIRVVGLEATSELPWAAIAEVALPFANRLDVSGSARHRALRAAVALEPADGPINPLAVALGVLGLLSDVATDASVLLVVDDVQWIDAESLAAISFLSRRLGDDPVALLGAARTDGQSLGTIIPVGALDDSSIRSLITGLGVRSPGVRDAVTSLADGNPLLARRLVENLTEEERSGSRLLPSAYRIPADLEELYRPAVERLDDRSALALAVVAADSSGETLRIGEALGEVDLTLADLEPVELARLVEVDGSSVRFVHPLARSAAYQVLAGPLRRRAHLALATAETDPAAATLHRAAGTVGTDDVVAGDLSDLAADAVRRGAPLLAAARFVQASALSTTAPDRAGRLVAAARSAMSAGEARWADELLNSAHETDPGRADGLDARSIRVQVAGALGDLDRARRIGQEADDAYAETDPEGVAAILVQVALPLLVEAPLEVTGIADRMWSLAVGGDGPTTAYAEVLYGCVRFVHGEQELGEKHADAWRDLLDREGPVAAGPFLAQTVVFLFGYSNRSNEALAILDAVEPAIRASSAAGALIPVLCARSFLTYPIDLRRCVEAGREALSLSAETRLPGLTKVAESTLSIAAATVGDDDVLAEVSRRLLASGTEAGEVWARVSTARLHLIRNRPEDAVVQFAHLRERLGSDNRTLTAFEADEAEALIRVGRIDDARALLPTLAADAQNRGAWSVGQYERTLALLAADVDEAITHFAAARDAFAQTDNKIAQGITELAWGERLRRAKRRAEARRHLELAIERFELVGGTAFRRRAEEELLAAGGTADRSRPTDELLGATELRVARLAAAGESNRAIADALFLSPRTVENHLGAVYRKLGVSGRPGLIARAVADRLLRPVTGD